ncbi:MAG: hypothetical protein ACT443_02440 [Gemmatimonadota bacterium]
MSELRLMLGITGTRLAREPQLTALGALGLVLGSFCLASVPFLGVQIPPEADLLDTAGFDIGVGIYVLTLAALLPVAGFAPARERAWRAAALLLFGYFYAIETVQAFRGLDPRFSEFDGTADQVAAALFGLSALGVIILTAMLAVPFLFMEHRVRLDARMLLAVRYGFAATTITLGTPAAVARRRIHIAGIAWLGACAAVFLHIMRA